MTTLNPARFGELAEPPARLPAAGETWWTTDPPRVRVSVLALYTDQGVPHVVYRFGRFDDPDPTVPFAGPVARFVADFEAP